jgi:hypothetical protein
MNGIIGTTTMLRQGRASAATPGSELLPGTCNDIRPAPPSPVRRSSRKLILPCNSLAPIATKKLPELRQPVTDVPEGAARGNWDGRRRWRPAARPWQRAARPWRPAARPWRRGSPATGPGARKPGSAEVRPPPRRCRTASSSPALIADHQAHHGVSTDPLSGRRQETVPWLPTRVTRQPP